SEALTQLSTLDSLRRTIDGLKCSLERFMNNGSVDVGCCPLGWDPFTSSCFLFSRQSLSWHEARDFCNGQQGHLAVLLTDKDWDFVTRHTSGTFYWIGLTDERGSWEWVNQTPYAMNRRQWMPGQPDAWTRHGLGLGDEDCAHLHFDGRLNDLHCSPGCASSARDTATECNDERQ
ncbi:LOW QUALITY PROTEIN: C-type lectin domain family 10 member A-like, partial [Salarias fasciatus]|uniref:LOW QUALITY PROTEIN: C-type lectin domain family 10 member A-like n=1 Tax=Salarias fasciatus TaxID=181472 RepID=UPI001176B4E7